MVPPKLLFLTLATTYGTYSLPATNDRGESPSVSVLHGVHSGELSQSPASTLPEPRTPGNGSRGLSVRVTVERGLLPNSTDGRIQVIFAPPGKPLQDIDVITSSDKIFGKNVFGVESGSSIVIENGSAVDTDIDTYGWPNVSLDALLPGAYRVQAFLTKYETAVRSDGSVVKVPFPCGDGETVIDRIGSLTGTATDVTLSGGTQIIDLKLTKITSTDLFQSAEVGGCNQGNYQDAGSLRHLKIRSEALSRFWNRAMYVGANIRLPPGYDNGTQRYPVLYHHDHWKDGDWYFGDELTEAFTEEWDSGMIPATESSPSRPTPKFIHVTFRHETPFYDNSYGVNTASMGPYGDALNDELIPLIDKTFRTIAAPWARVVDGGSTGGWISAATLAYRPDLFGACFAAYPDPLDFHKFQDISLYTNKNAYQNADGSSVPSIRDFDGDTEVILASTSFENHWELAFGTSSRSFLQWDAWQAVFGAQGYNGYPLETWDKYTGEIYPEAVQLWRPFDLADYITTNWEGPRSLGHALKNRMFIYVGGRDRYFLNEGVQEFQKRIEAKGGAGWANFTIPADQGHDGVYNGLPQWTFFELIYQWMMDHSPQGKTPLSPDVTRPSSRGNLWQDVLAHGGRQAAVARQSDPLVEPLSGGHGAENSTVVATSGRWDPGVKLEAQWYADKKPVGKAFAVGRDERVELKRSGLSGVRDLQLRVTGRKRGYKTETRTSNSVKVKG